MADIVTLGDVSTKDAGSGSQLKTGGRRQYNMPKKCVEMKIKEGMSKEAAVKACYPISKKKHAYGYSEDLKVERVSSKVRRGVQKVKRKRAMKKATKKGY